MKKINYYVCFLLFIMQSISAQTPDFPYHQIVCSSNTGDGWIKILVNKKQANDQLLYIYNQGGLGPGNLWASYQSIGLNNSFSIDTEGKIQLRANFSMGLHLNIEYSYAEIKSEDGNMPMQFQFCSLR
jgi:hypothetical protein